MDPFIVTRAGVQMPRLIYGTAWKKDRTADLVVEAVKAGFRGIDTACQPKHYHEPGVGAALRTLAAAGIPRSSLFVQTKFTSLSGQDRASVPYDAKAPLADQVAQSFKVSQANLGTDYVDSLVLHGPLARFADTLAVWRAMEAVHAAGGARQLGVSNFYSPREFAQLYEQAEVKPAVLQNRWYGETRHDQALRRFCRARGVVYQSFWTLTANPELLAAPPLMRAAARVGKSPEATLFRFLLQRGVAPLTGTCSRAHMDADLDALHGGWELTEAEVAAIGAEVDEDFGEDEKTE